MESITISTSKNKEVVNITDKVNKLIKEKGFSDGLCHIFVAHTTCAITTADLDPGTDQDYLEAIQKIFPKGNYHHPHDPSHVGDHIMSSIIGPDVDIPIVDGKLN